jgi:hypothetical protein
MSCWVVPALAAEIWGIPLQQILDAIRSGKLPAKSAIGLTFVDVAPAGPKARTGFRPPAAAPNTFTSAPLADELSDAEVAALSHASTGDDASARDGDEEILSTVDEYEDGKLDWRQARRSASRLRLAPRRLAA